MLNVNFVNELSGSEAKAIFIDENLKMDSSLITIDQHTHGLISKVIKDKSRFAGEFGQVKTISFASKNNEIEYLIVVGLGNEAELKENCLEQLGGKVLAEAATLKVATVGLHLSEKTGRFGRDEAAALLAAGGLLASYRFDKYFTTKKEEEKFSVKNIECLVGDIAAAEKDFMAKKSVVMGVFLARDCISEPPNILYPESYAEIILDALEPFGVEVEIYGEREMKNLGMGALLGVGQGSTNESKLVVMKYMGTSEDKIHAAFVGKGVTFDTGGISIKPAAGMETMKYDMAGSAAVVGLMKALTLREAKVNVVGVVGLVENMPGGNAQRPSDVVKTMSGKSVEVLNTDAEGRLVLADAIWYAQEQFKPGCVVDLATLTGAIKVALGYTYAGLFSNDEELAQGLTKAGERVGEKLWRMPLHKDYDEMLKSDIADVANIGNLSGVAGSSTAAQFIGRFIQDKMPWAHLDIAGVAWVKRNKNLCPTGAAGFGVRLLNQFVRDNYEAK